jgi:hypothetical protein
MTEFGEKLAKDIEELINSLEELACEQPDQYFFTPYQTLHGRLLMALESYKNASTTRFPNALQKPAQSDQDNSSRGE